MQTNFWRIVALACIGFRAASAFPSHGGIPQLGNDECGAIIGAERNSGPPTLKDPKLACPLHQGPEDFGRQPTRDDGRNLLIEAQKDG